MTDSINIIGADVRSINDTHNTVYMSKYSKDSDNQKQFIPLIPQVSSMGGGNGLQAGSQRLQLMLPTGSAAYDVNNSSFNYVMRFMLDTNVPNWTKLTNTGISVPMFGTFTLYQAAWWYQPYVLVPTEQNKFTDEALTIGGFDPITGCPCAGTIYQTTAGSSAMTGTQIGYTYGLEWQPYGDAYCISSAPYHAMQVINRSAVNFNTMNDDEVQQWRRYLSRQLELDPHIQDTQYMTWFYGTKPAITFSFLPYVIDQTPKLIGGIPNPRFGTKVADGRLWNRYESAFHQAIHYTNTEATVRAAAGTSDFMYDGLTAGDKAYSGSWVWGASDKERGTWRPHQYPDLTCGYRYDIEGNKYKPVLTPGKGAMTNVISVPLPSVSTNVGSARYILVQNVEFQIPLKYINPIFDTKNPLFFANCLGTSVLQIHLTTHQQNMYDVWGNSRMFGLRLAAQTVTQVPGSYKEPGDSFTAVGANQGFGPGTVSPTLYLSNTQYQEGMTTAMIDAAFFADQKHSPLLTSDLTDSRIIASRCEKHHYSPIGTYSTTTVQTFPIQKALRNMKEVQILVCANDLGAVDNGIEGYADDPAVQTSSSLYLHGHSTLMTETQFLIAQNQEQPDVRFNYLGGFNIRLSNNPSSYMYQGRGFGLSNIKDFLHETLASRNLLCNRTECSSPYLFQFGDNCVTIISAEKFSNMMMRDISFDGIDTTGQPVMLQWGISTYDVGNYVTNQGPSTPYDENNVNTPKLPQSYIIEVYQVEEQWIIYNPAAKTIQKVNDVRGMGLPENITYI